MMDEVTHFLFLAALILVIICTLVWLSGFSCLWGFAKANNDLPQEVMAKAMSGAQDAWDDVADFTDSTVDKACSAAQGKEEQMGFWENLMYQHLCKSE